MFPRPAPPSPSQYSEEGIQKMKEVEENLQELPLVASLRQRKEEFYEARPYESYPEEKRIHSLTAGTLAGPGKFAVRPLIFAKWDESESVVIVHLGRSLCGHDGIIHGGLLATLLDETLARNAFFNLPSKIGVTASLLVNYRAPTKADQFIVIRTKLENLKGRKAVVSGRIENLDGTLLVEAKGTFVEPKYAKALNVEGITRAMGSRPKPGHPIVGVDVAVTS
ncbi:hypothetical protein FRC02_000126 [Tulasnella sp. 418]|nr:hypothetical protein FRC02_000126 [Tulasnella sp. 418]